MKKSSKLLVASVFVIILILTATIIFKNYGQTQNVTINYKNSNNIQIYTAGGEDPTPYKETVSDIKSSGQKVRLKKDSVYILRYDGDDGYTGGDITITTPIKEPSVDINPYFSDDKLASLVNDESSKINDTIKSKYNKIGLYNIEKGKLYHFGEWYSTKLTYKGKDAFNSDSLRIVLKKTGSSWEVKTDPPNIFLSKQYYKNVPEDILIDANKL